MKNQMNMKVIMRLGIDEEKKMIMRFVVNEEKSNEYYEESNEYESDYEVGYR